MALPSSTTSEDFATVGLLNIPSIAVLSFVNMSADPENGISATAWRKNS